VLTWQRRIVNQEGKVVQEGITQTLVEGRAAEAGARDAADAKEPPAEESPGPSA
jgi:hypothetical protein